MLKISVPTDWVTPFEGVHVWQAVETPPLPTPTFRDRFSTSGFQKTTNKIFAQVPEVRTHIEDILIWSSKREGHDARLHTALLLAKSAGLTLNVALG